MEANVVAKAIYGITKDDFVKYCVTQCSRLFNMWDYQMEHFANLTKEQHVTIVRHYAEIKEFFEISEQDEHMFSELGELTAANNKLTLEFNE